MNLPENFNFKPLNILKIAGIILAVIIVIALAIRLIGSSFSSFNRNISFQKSISPSYDAGYATDEMSYEAGGMGYAQTGKGQPLSLRNVISSEVPPAGAPAPGNKAEQFEVTEYSATIETRHLADSCAKIADLKAREDVVFESANDGEHSCNFYFKVKTNSVPEIVALIKSMNPKDMNESTYTIQRQIEDYTSEQEILEKKLASIDATLTNAVTAYDEITKLAIQTKDVESLAKIIDSKIMIIERLTQERINVNAQLEQLQRAKAQQLDRLEYTYFSVYIYEDKFIDGEALADSWKAAVKSFVFSINQVAQDLTVNLIALLFIGLQYFIYFFIILIIVKYAWKLAKYIWKNN